MFELPIVENLDDLQESDLDYVAFTLIGGTVSNWPKYGFIQPNALTPFYKVLFKLALIKWFLSLHNSIVRLEKAHLIFGIGTGKKIDLASLIYNHIKKAVESRRKS